MAQNLPPTMPQFSSSPNPSPAPPPPNVDPEPVGMILVRLPLALLLGVVAAVVCGVLWGLLAYFTESIFLYGAIAIGGVVSFAITSAFKRITWPIALLMFFPALLLTVGSVLFGDLLFYVLVVMKEFEVGFLDAALTVLENVVEIATDKDEAASYIFALIGAGLGFFGAVRRGA